MSNPLGIIYNPISIGLVFDQLLSTVAPTLPDDLVVQQDGLWHSLLHHGKFSQISLADLHQEIELARQRAHVHLKQTNFLLITMGSAHAYRFRRTGDIVTNCHKLEATLFEKILFNSDEIISALEHRVLALKLQNPDLQFILTVSPVRYIRDGLIENNRSKAALITAVHYLADNYEYCHYFPAYELVIDELRDYRFFQSDMVHPSDQAVEFVLEKFVSHYFKEEAKDQVQRIAKLRRMLLHRALHPGSKSYDDFKGRLKDEIDRQQKFYSDLDFAQEWRMLEDLP